MRFIERSNEEERIIETAVYDVIRTGVELVDEAEVGRTFSPQGQAGSLHK